MASQFLSVVHQFGYIHPNLQDNLSGKLAEKVGVTYIFQPLVTSGHFSTRKPILCVLFTSLTKQEWQARVIKYMNVASTQKCFTIVRNCRYNKTFLQVV